MPRKARALRGHSDAVLRYQNGSESCHNHTAVNIRAGTGEQRMVIPGISTGSLSCARSEMCTSSGKKGQKTNEHQQDPEVYPAVKSLENVKQGRKLMFFLWQPLLNFRMFNSSIRLCYT